MQFFQEVLGILNESDAMALKSLGLTCSRL
jgi:hypothetical protein